MELFTLVSLLLGICTAGNAALGAFRANFDESVKDARRTLADREKRARIHFEKHKGEDGVPHPDAAHCVTFAKKIRWWSNCWYICHVIPMFVFLLYLTALILWVLWDWENIIRLHKPEEAQAYADVYRKKLWYALALLCGLNLTSIVSAFFSRRNLLIADAAMNDRCRAADHMEDNAPNPGEAVKKLKRAKKSRGPGN